MLYISEMFDFLISSSQFVIQVQIQSISNSQSGFCLLSGSHLINLIALVEYFSKVQQTYIMESRFCFGVWYRAVILLDHLQESTGATSAGISQLLYFY